MIPIFKLKKNSKFSLKLKKKKLFFSTSTSPIYTRVEGGKCEHKIIICLIKNYDDQTERNGESQFFF
jgi:hypothetical protein